MRGNGGGHPMTRLKKTLLCPLGGVGVGGKWKFWIWYHLLSGTKRFGELQRLVPQASRQMLTIQLRELERMGVVHRQVRGQDAPKVEYSLTALRQRSGPLLRQMYAWGRWFCDQAGLEFDWPVSDEADTRLHPIVREHTWVGPRSREWAASPIGA